MPYCKKNNFLILLLFIVGTITAQIVPSKQVSTLNGLPNNQVESIFKDSRGILWVGTNNGVSKIENGQITNFYASDGLAHNSAWSIIEDANNNIWIGSHGGGVTKFDGKTFTIFNTKNGLVNNYIRKLFNYKNYIFIGTEDGLSIINTKNDNISTFDASGVLNRNGVKDFQVMDYFVYKNEIYCATLESGIFKLNIEEMAVKRVFNYHGNFLFSNYLNNNTIFYAIDNRGGGHSGSLKKFNIDSLLADKKEITSFGKSIIWDYATDHKNNLYGAAWGVHSDNGGVYQIKANTFIDRSTDFGVDSKSVRCLYFDKKFNFLYIGTQDKGFYKVDLNENIIFYKNNKLHITDVLSLKKKFYFLTKKGLKITQNNAIIKHQWKHEFYDYALHKLTHIPETPKVIFHYFINQNSTEYLSFKKIIYNKNGIWISTNIGLFQLNTHGDFLNYYPIITNEFEFNKKNELLNPIPYSSFDVISNLQNYTTSTLDFEPKRFLATNPNTPVNVSAFQKLNEKIVVATLYRGLFIYENDTFSSLNETNIFNELEIGHLAFIKESNALVIGTVSGEVYLADVTKDFKIIKKIDRKLMNGNSIVFLETYKNYILIGTNEGLTIYNDGKFQFIDHDQGLVKHQLTSSIVIDDELIVGTNEGYYVFNLPKIINPNPENLKLEISDISINNKKVSKNQYYWFNYMPQKLNLNHNQNRININFKANNTPYPTKLRYKYNISGLDSIWSDYSTNTNIFLHYVPSGVFNIVVKTTDLNSGKEYTTNLLTVKVSLPYWKTWWFRTLFIFQIVLISYVIYRIRTRLIRNVENQKSEIQKRLLETKLEALQSQMNPHFTFNAMNSIQNYIIDNDTDNALMYLSEFAKLIRKTLDNSSHQKISLTEEISYLKSYITLENMRFENKITIHIHKNNLNTNSVFMPPMLIEPFVENVFIHAFDAKHPNPTLTINFSIKNNSLQCEIIDNGKGIQKSTLGKLHKSKGLKLVTERLYLLNKSGLNNFNIRSNAQGTTVLLNLQLQNTNG
ncbi:MAG: hypothetical protein GQ540_10830 [Lutibacter sp.]|uniref:sensor histidine kinase n=1 Tax=Lutibacter sp. TaxID=1925666 RepID=UPI0019F51D68|nr:histidine kinase [Lutibacter sp.]NOR29008.1 hypothetical protein [Lutibacter sp.]